LSIEKVKIINLPKIEDLRGNLSFIESKKHIPFDIKRVYWIYDIPGGEIRGSHAYRTLQEFIIALSRIFYVMYINFCLKMQIHSSIDIFKIDY